MLYRVGFRGKVSRSTLADTNDTPEWRIYANFAEARIPIARPTYAGEPLGFERDNAVYALDSTMSDRCMSVFSWASSRA